MSDNVGIVTLPISLQFGLPRARVASVSWLRGMLRGKRQGEASLNLLSFEIDIWGRLRRATEAARANLLSADENRKAVITTLVADVATSYLTLRELDDEMDISRRTLSSRQESLTLIESRHGGGVATRLDRRQGEQLVFTASETIPALQQQIEQTENQLNLLLARAPGTIDRGRRLTEQELPPEVPAGLTSALLERRPDIRAAEQRLIAGNANIGVAKAAYFRKSASAAFLAVKVRNSQACLTTRIVRGASCRKSRSRSSPRDASSRRCAWRKPKSRARSSTMKRPSRPPLARCRMH